MGQKRNFLRKRKTSDAKKESERNGANGKVNTENEIIKEQSECLHILQNTIIANQLEEDDYGKTNEQNVHKSNGTSDSTSIQEEPLDIVETKNEDTKFVSEMSRNNLDISETTSSLSMPSKDNNQPDSKSSTLRRRKYSVDHTLLARPEELSRSELDLVDMGKSPLERKSSFFRKKLDNFMKNTTELFRGQSFSYKPHIVQRRGSKSMSLQSLNKDIECKEIAQDDPGSTVSLQSCSSVSAVNDILIDPEQLSEHSSLAGSQTKIFSSQPIVNDPEDLGNNPNEVTLRAVSMSSGLNDASERRQKRNRRSTWMASEGLANYWRRLLQGDSSSEIPHAKSYQDIGVVPKGRERRLSYQRAVSGEDPMPTHSVRRSMLIPENSEANYEPVSLSELLTEFSRNGVPPLWGFSRVNLPEQAIAFLHNLAEIPTYLEELYEWKKLSANEEARQTVIRELISTEVAYIRHLFSIVDVFMAAAYALQENGRLLDLDIGRLFLNLPEVLNVSLCFWEITIYPMLADAYEKHAPFNTELMSPGFCRFREIFLPYEKYVSEQTKALDYLRSLYNNQEVMLYISWCHSQKSCNRLQLSDLLIMPMQRLTKYHLILNRIAAHTDTEPERTSLKAMESFAVNYVTDLNRSIRQRDELEKLDSLAYSIEPYEIDFKDEDMDKFFRMYAQTNLKAPMVNCLPSHSRSLIHCGDLRFKDPAKEMDVRVVLLTDMLLICKKQSKGFPYKLVRPKYMVDKLVMFHKYNRTTKELTGLVFVVVDEVGSAFHSFCLMETGKELQGALKLWELKIKEAKLTYDLGVWYAKNPSRDMSDMEMDSSSDYAVSAASKTQKNSEDVNIEREARERVATMLHRSMGASTEYDFSQASMTTDSFDGEASATSGARTPGLHSLRHPMHRNSTGGSSRNSRLSSFHQSTSAASHDEPQAGPSKYTYKAGSSVEHLIPPLHRDDAVTSITVNVVSESESETVVPHGRQSPRLSWRSSSPNRNTLRVNPQSCVMALVHSLPDLTVDASPPRSSQSPSPQSISERLYQSHQEMLKRNRLSATQHQYLSPDQRGTSYPPPSPTRASLKRGFAFSYSLKNPPLSKMGHVNSQSQLQTDQQPAGSSNVQQKTEKDSSGKTSNAQDQTKKTKPFSSRHKGDDSGLPGSSKKDKD